MASEQMRREPRGIELDLHPECARACQSIFWQSINRKQASLIGVRSHPAPRRFPAVCSGLNQSQHSHRLYLLFFLSFGIDLSAGAPEPSCNL